MTPDRMRGWLTKIPAGAKSVQLSADAPTGLMQLSTWERSEVEESKGVADGDVADAILAAAQDYADGEEQRQKFVVRWMGNRSKPLKTTTHWATPKPRDEATEDAESVAPGISDATIIRDLLRAHGEKDRVLMQALTAQAAAYERVIAMQQDQIAAVHSKQLEALDTPSHTGTVVELSEIQEAEVQQRTEALKALTDKLPDVLDLAINAVAAKLLQSADSGGEASATVVASNGAASAGGAH